MVAFSGSLWLYGLACIPSHYLQSDFYGKMHPNFQIFICQIYLFFKLL